MISVVWLRGHKSLNAAWQAGNWRDWWNSTWGASVNSNQAAQVI